MKIGLYSFAALALMGIIVVFTYTINSGNYIVEVMGINFNLPIAGWIVLPMFILFVFTLIHMVFYGLKGYFLLKKWQKDAGTLEDALYWSLIGEPKEQKFSTEALSGSASVLSRAVMGVSDMPEGLTPRLTRVIGMIQKIKNGEYIDLKEEKMSKAFHIDNPISIQNRLNRLDIDEKFVEEVLRSASEHPLEVRAKALRLFSTTQRFEKARKYVKVFNTEHFLMMLERISTDNRLELTPAILTEFVTVLKPNCKDFVRIASVCKKYFTPDESLALFKAFRAEYENAESAYLYLLFEYELLNEVALFLDEQGEEEFVKFRVLHTLKKQHHKYKFEDIIDIQSICQ
jgi:hypothetical protein